MSKNRKLKILAGLIILLILLLLARIPILQGIGNFLVYENPMQPVKAIFVLSGGAWDRGNEAAKLYHEGLTDQIVCPGENVPRLFLIADIQYTESELTKMHINQLGVPEEDIILLKGGTSTNEESELILNYCKENDIHKLAVVSTKFHTRRVKYSFKKKFEKEGLQLIIHGAPSSAFDENYWWRSEYGAIFVNNEYIKLFYYWLKH